MTLEEYKEELEKCVSEKECQELISKAAHCDDLSDKEFDELQALKIEKINNM